MNTIPLDSLPDRDRASYLIRVPKETPKPAVKRKSHKEFPNASEYIPTPKHVHEEEMLANSNVKGEIANSGPPNAAKQRYRFPERY
jgi:hypothetical protein